MEELYNALKEGAQGRCTESDMSLPTMQDYGAGVSLLVSINGSPFMEGTVTAESDIRYSKPRQIAVDGFAEIFIYGEFIEILSGGNLQFVKNKNFELVIYELRDPFTAETATKYRLGLSEPVSHQQNLATYSKTIRRERRTILRTESLPTNTIHLKEWDSSGLVPVTPSDVDLFRYGSHDVASEVRTTCLGPEKLHESKEAGIGHLYMWAGWISDTQLNFACLDGTESFSVTIPEDCRNPVLGFSDEGSPWYGYIDSSDVLHLFCAYRSGVVVNHTVPNTKAALVANEDGVIKVLGGGYAD